MNKISYFKLQAKNFLRDFKTQKKDQEGIYFYSPKFFKDIMTLLYHLISMKTISH